jgi:hypothetical protein
MARTGEEAANNAATTGGGDHVPADVLAGAKEEEGTSPKNLSNLLTDIHANENDWSVSYKNRLVWNPEDPSSSVDRPPP